METNVAKRQRLIGRGARSLRRKLLPVLIAGCFGSALANPLGPQVVNGQASFSQQGNTLSVTNTPGAVINWQAFSIGSSEVTRFIQQSANSSVLNRVVGQDPSQILGALQSNGRVFLINPNGILFGAGAQVNVNGLIASTLDISNEDFLNGKMRFNAAGAAGNLKNEGTITTPNGGQVYLIAPNVENSGIITSPKGEVMLAAGHSVELVDSANPDLHVVLSAPGNEAVNVGEIVTQGGKTGIFGDLVRHSGIINADSAVVGENGKIVFKASGDTLLENGSRTTATGAGTGGDIYILGDRVGLSGDTVVDASGQQGGGTVLVGGDYQGKNSAIKNATHTYLGKDTRINADAIQNGDGGKVIIWADKSTAAYGKVSARGGAESGNGGFVETSGKEHLVYRGTTDVRAEQGATGTLLLDPANLVIMGGSGDGSDDGTLSFGGNTPGTVDVDYGPSIIYETEIEAQSASANIVIEAGDGITTDGTFIDGAVTLASDSNLRIGTRNGYFYEDGTTGIDLTGSAHGTDLEFRTQGSGSILMEGGYDGTAGPVSVTVGKLTSDAGSITVRSNGSLLVNDGVVTHGGNVELTSEDVTISGTGQVLSQGGNVAVSANAMDISGSINAGTGAVLLKPIAYDGLTSISLGGGALPDIVGVLSLNSDELNRITTSHLLQIGDYDVTGDITVAQPLALGGNLTGALSLNAGLGNLAINSSLSTPGMLMLSTGSGGNITQSSAGAISATSLMAAGGNVQLDQAGNPVGVISGSSFGDFRYRTANKLTVSEVAGVSGINAGGDVVLESLHAEGINQIDGNAITTAGGLALKSVGQVELHDAGNNVAVLAADVNQDGSAFGFRNAGDLQIGSVDGINGISTTDGNVKLAVSGTSNTLTVAQEISTGDGEVDLIADNLSLAYAINAPMVSIEPFTSGRGMTIGAGCGGTCLSVTNLFHINATTIGLGHETKAGPIHVAGITAGGTTATSRSVSTTRIGLITSGGITQSGSINVQQLGIDAGGDVNLSLANSVVDLAAETNGYDLDFRNSGSLTVKTIDGADYGDDYLIDGITTSDGNVSLTVDTGDINVQAEIDTGVGDVALAAGGNINVGAVIASGPSGNIGLTANTGDIVLSSLLDAGDTGSVNLSAANGSIGGGGIVFGHYLDAVASDGITLVTAVDGLSAENTGPGSDISIVNAQPVTLYNVSQSGAGSTGDISITNVGALTVASGHAVTAQNGAISISTYSPLTVNGTVSTSSAAAGQGNITLSANSSDAPLTDNLTINGAVTANAGNITLSAGNDIVGADKAVTASGTKTVTSSLNAGGTTTTQTQASNTIQTAIAPTATQTTNTTTTSGSTTSGTTAPLSEPTPTEPAGTASDGTQESEETKDGESTTAEKTADGAKENEPAQKLYCN